jgi:type I restriction enzyme S subunit
VRLRDVSRDCGQKIPDKRFTYIDVSAIDDANGAIAHPTILEPDEAPSRARKLVQLGTIIYSTVRPYLLNIAVIEETIEPETIAKLRQSILQLAVQGKLVPQDPTDEPASVLLTKIKAEKERLVKEKGVGRGGSRTAQATQVSPDEVPYELPQGWKWARVGETAEQYVDCPHATPHYTGHGYICLRAPNIVASNLLLQEVRYVSPEEYKTRIQRLKPRKNDLIYIREGGRLGIAGLITSDESFCLGQRLMLLRFVHTETAYYVSHFLNAPLTYAKFVGKILGGASPHVNVRDVVAHPIPLPPLAEQHRIVAKVDQLIAFCDDLEARLTKTQAKAEKLTAATVQGLLAA